MCKNFAFVWGVVVVAIGAGARMLTFSAMPVQR